MKAIEINSKTDNKGILKIDYQLDRADSDVRVLILVDDYSDENEEKLWMNAIATNPAFDFLKDKSEDIYSIHDGEPFND
jgi:hypothetical protein